MAAQSREPTVDEEQERGLLGQIEVHSIDWIPDTERHGKVWQQTMLWFLGNFQYFTIPVQSQSGAGTGGPVAGPEQTVHVIDVPAELESVQDAGELHSKLQALLAR